MHHPEALDDAAFPATLDAARRGETWAIEALFVDLQPRLLRFLRTSEPRAADDLAGEVWLALASGIATFDGDLAGLRAWVFTIARRRLADHRRSGARRRTEPASDVGVGQADGSADPERDVLDQLSAQHAVDLVVRALPPDLAEVILLRVVAGLDVAHVADVMGRSANWVRVTQHRALRRLADRFPATTETPVTQRLRRAI